MSEIKCGGLILEAIDQLRKRKARPDLDRICHMLQRRHGLKGTAVNEELSRLVSEGTVVKVDYKGNTSYRNAAKWVKTKTQFFGSFYNSSDVSHSVLEAVRALTLPTKEQPEVRSVSVQDIERYMMKKDAQYSYNLNTLRTVLEKEVAKGSLCQLSSGEFGLVKTHTPDNETPEKTCDNVKKDPGSATKRLKTETKPLENSNSNDEYKPSRCDYCLLTSSANRKGEPEELLVCKDCSSKAHPSCMEYTKLLYEPYPEPQNWQCPDCKTCIVCEEVGDSEDLLTCYICFKGYHLNCHNPEITSKVTGVWFCHDCDSYTKDKEKPDTKIKTQMQTSDEENESDNVVQAVKDGFIKSIEEYPASIPVAKKWSIENVEAFFKHVGFEDEAPAFREQEIDGMSLLLMKRNDVLTGLGIKLGPALKIYKHVVKLQSRIDN